MKRRGVSVPRGLECGVAWGTLGSGLHGEYGRLKADGGGVADTSDLDLVLAGLHIIVGHDLFLILVSSEREEGGKDKK